MDQFVMFFTSACKNGCNSNSHDEFIEDSSNNHGVFGTVFNAKHMTQDKFAELLSLTIVECQERYHNFEEFQDRFVQLFGRCLVF